MFTVCALYHFTRFDDPAALRGTAAVALRGRGDHRHAAARPRRDQRHGRRLRRGNRPAAGPIRALPGCDAIEVKLSTAGAPPFGRMKVRLKREIVSMGQPDVDPRAAVGHYLDPEDWNRFIAQDDVVVIDTRNDYEVAIGTFRGAVDPHTTSFREFPAWWAENAARFHNKRIAMFCTGGIRCEKSTNYLLSQGVEEVYHLKGGILRYLEDMPENESLWEGACFVFDERVSVEHGLTEGPHVLCRACRRPLAPDDTAHPDYEEGVCCPHCVDAFDEARRARFRERHRQVKLAEARGARHLGQRLAKDS